MTQIEKITILAAIWEAAAKMVYLNRYIGLGFAVFSIARNHPELTDKVLELIGTDKDCSYNDNKIQEFLAALFS